MMNDSEFERIEERLSDEARRLQAIPQVLPAASHLASEFRRRVRRRRMYVAGSVAAAVLLAGIGIGLYRSEGRRPNLGRIEVQDDGRSPAEQQLPNSGNDAVEFPTDPLEPVAIPVLIAGRTEEGQQVVVTGWFLSEQALATQLDEFSNTVSQRDDDFLDVEADLTDDRTI